MITGEIDSSIEIHTNFIVMNPHKIVDPLEAYLRGYVRELRNKSNVDLRDRFEARFDFDNGVK